LSHRKLHMIILPVLALLLVTRSNAQVQRGFVKVKTADKVYGLSLLWNEVGDQQTNIANRQWNETYHEYIEKALNAYSLFVYYRTLQGFVATLNTVHVKVVIPGILRRQLTMPPVRLINNDHRAIVSNVSDKLAEKIPIGSEVLKVAGIDAKYYLQNYVLPYVNNGSSKKKWDMAIEGVPEMGIGLLTGPAGSSFAISIRTPNGEVRKFNLYRVRGDKDISWVKPIAKKNDLIQFKWLEKSLAYVNISNQTNDIFFQSSQLSQARGLIIDIRNINTDVNPNNQAAVHNILEEANSIPVAILIGKNTHSATDFLCEIKQRKNVTFVGQPVSGSRHAIKELPMPGGGFAYVRVLKPDQESEPVEVVKPDILVNTGTNNRNEKDAVLLKGREVLGIWMKD
jgi:hypothetical protein